MDDTLMMASHISYAKRPASRGVSLIIVLIMMIIIGITAATAMRSATSEQRATNNQRQEATALQYAEAALRYCESQIALPDASRNPKLVQANIVNTTSLPWAWENAASWNALTGGAAATRVNVPDANLQVAASDVVLPPSRPQCIAEYVTGFGSVVTARGFSPDYTADAGGNTLTGAVVWLQSITN